MIASIFEIRIVSIIGFTPFVTGCCICKKTDFGDNILFSFINHGLICKNCIKTDKNIIILSIGVVKTIIFLVSANIKQLFNFELSKEVLIELNNFSKRYLQNTLEKEYNKLDFLNQFK